MTKEEIISAYNIISPFLHKTPILTSQAINEKGSCKIFFKCENFQKVGAFKARGAMNAVESLSLEALQKGVATHSSGNHGQALAWAAKSRGIKAFIVVPATAPEVKKAAMKEYGAIITECEPTLAARESTLSQVVAKTGATIIHPYNDERIITGQATAAYEIFQDVDDLDFLLAPVGGGGLLSGSSLAAKYFSPKTHVIGCEPEGADDAFRSLKEKKIIPSENPKTIADGLLTSLGDKTFPIIRDNVKDILTTSDDQIREALLLIWQRMKIIIEPSAAVPLACLLHNKAMFEGKRIAIILSGGNVQLTLPQ